MHLLLIFLAWAIALLISPWIRLDVARVHYRHDAAANDLRSIRMWAVSKSLQDSNISFIDLDANELWSELGSNLDPWGHEYQIVERYDAGDFGTTFPFHAYSFGQDGKSDSLGNDLDDVNTWTYDRSRFYGRMIASDQRRQNIWRSLYIAPFTFMGLLLIRRRFRYTNSETQR